MRRLQSFITLRAKALSAESQKITPHILDLSLWVGVCFLAVIRFEINESCSGNNLSISLLELLIMALTYCGLKKSLQEKNWKYACPWVVMMLFTMYTNEISGLHHVINVMKTSEFPIYAPLMALIINFMCMAARLCMLLKIIPHIFISVTLYPDFENAQ